MTIKEIVKQIRSAVYGKDMRESIAQGIEKIGGAAKAEISSSLTSETYTERIKVVLTTNIVVSNEDVISVSDGSFFVKKDGYYNIEGYFYERTGTLGYQLNVGTKIMYPFVVRDSSGHVSLSLPLMYIEAGTSISLYIYSINDETSTAASGSGVSIQRVE